LARTATDKRSRAPQGAKRVAQAFFTELETIAEDKQAEVGKAAQAMVRETMMARREKAKTAKAKIAQPKTRAGKAAPTGSRAGATPERATRGPARKRKATPARRARPAEPDVAQEAVEASEET